MSDVGKKDDQTKLRMDLISVPALEGLAEVLTHGAQKYGDRNWEKGIAFSRVYAALLRHLLAWWDGENRDCDSELHHLKHVLCNAMFLAHYTSSGFEAFDDRPQADEIAHG